MIAPLLAVALALPPAERPITLEEAYTFALHASEDLAMREDNLAEVLARTDEIIAAAKPSLHWQATHQIQDAPSDPSGVSSSFNQPARTDSKLAARQPLFAGFREFLAYRAALRRGESVSLDRLRAQALLYQDTAAAFLNLLGWRKELDIRRAAIAITRDRVMDLQARERLGRSRKSEVLAAQAQLAQNEASLETALGQERVSQESLKFLTGLEDDLSPQDLPPPTLEPVAGFLARADMRPDVAARRRDLEASLDLEQASRRQRWPTIAFDGNYHVRRAGIQEGVRWDLLFTGTLPLYSGGAVTAQVLQAQARARAADLALRLAVRKARREVRSAHRELEHALSGARALDKAAALAEANAKAQAEDYRHDLVANQDVLASLAALQDARLRLARSRLDALATRSRLEVAAGPGGTP